MGARVSYQQFSDSAAQNYERYFVPAIATPVAGILLEAARLQPGERVLDVACGTGVVAHFAAERVGPGGRVVGADVSSDMIAVARRAPAPTGAEIEWHEADATALPFADGAFDAVLCQMGLPFVEDKEAAVREMRRVVAAGGRVVASTPGRMQRPFEIMAEALSRHIGSDVGKFVHVVFSMDDPDAVGRLLREAGLRDVEARETMATLNLPAPADFLWQYIHLTPMGGFMSEVPEEAKRALEEEVVERWQPFVGDDGTMDGKQPMVVARGRA